MPGFKVRYSKYRHVYGQPFRKEKCYESIVMSKNTADGNYCAVNPKYLAIVTESGGGGSFIVVPIENCGRIDPNYPRVCGHSSSVLDLKWYPFNDNIIASCSGDGSVIIWEIPEPHMEENLTDYMVKLQGHSRKCVMVEWHPTASSILASAGFDGKVIVWNIEREEAVSKLDCGNTSILSISFNWDGSLMASTTKDKKLKVFDPRTGDVFQEGICHAGVRSTRCVFVGDTDMIVTVGNKKGSERELSLWNQNDIKAPIARMELGSGTGVLYPFVDHDSNIVFIAGKGDGNILYYEVLETSPYLFALNQYSTGNPQRGFGVMPKRGVNTSNCEIMRFYKVHASRCIVEPISMIVPRRYESMQKDLYPDTVSCEPAMTAGEWISGINRPPNLMSLGGISRKVRTEPKPILKAAKEEVKQEPPKAAIKPRIDQSKKGERPELKEEPVEAKKPRQELSLSPETMTEEKDEPKELEQWDIIEDAVTITTNGAEVESAPASSDIGDERDEVKQDYEKGMNDTSELPQRNHPLTGMEGSLTLSQRLARWENNNNASFTPQSFKRKETPPKAQPKPEKRTHPQGEGTSSPERKPKAKVERSLTQEGKEIIRIDMDESISVLPQKAAETKDARGHITMITEASHTGSSVETNDLITSKEMGADQIRKAYLRQKEEIKQLKSQLHLKDARIRALEKELEQYTASNC